MGRCLLKCFFLPRFLSIFAKNRLATRVWGCFWICSVGSFLWHSNSPDHPVYPAHPPGGRCLWVCTRQGSGSCKSACAGTEVLSRGTASSLGTYLALGPALLFCCLSWFGLSNAPSSLDRATLSPGPIRWAPLWTWLFSSTALSPVALGGPARGVPSFSPTGQPGWRQEVALWQLPGFQLLPASVLGGWWGREGPLWRPRAWGGDGACEEGSGPVGVAQDSWRESLIFCSCFLSYLTCASASSTFRRASRAAPVWFSPAIS